MEITNTQLSPPISEVQTFFLARNTKTPLVCGSRRMTEQVSHTWQSGYEVIAWERA